MFVWATEIRDAVPTCPVYFQHPPSSWNVVAHAHPRCELMKLGAWEGFGEAVSKVVAGWGICVVEVACFDSFMYVVMLDVDVFRSCMERRITS